MKTLIGIINVYFRSKWVLQGKVWRLEGQVFNLQRENAAWMDQVCSLQQDLASLQRFRRGETQ